MISEERLRPMIKMAVFDKNEGQSCKLMIKYEKTDYISLQLLKGVVSGSIAFFILAGMWFLYDTESVFQRINSSDITGFLTGFLILYGIFMILYLSVTYLVYQTRYRKGRKLVKNYCENLKEINKVYEREEKLKAPSQKDWE